MLKPPCRFLLLFLCSTAYFLNAQSSDTLLAHQYLEQAKQLIKDRDLEETASLLEKATTIFAKHAQWENWTRARTLLQKKYFLEGAYADAVAVIDSTLILVEEPLGPRNLEVNKLLLEKAKSIYEQGQFQESIDLAEKMLPDLKLWFGENSAVVGNAYLVLVDAYSDVGSYEKSVDFALKNLQLCQSSYGNVHPSTAEAFSRVGSSYIYLKKMEEALSYEEKALENWLQIHQDEYHPNLGTNYSNLGICYTELGEMEKAETFFLKAYEVKKRVYGEVHPDIANFLWNLGIFYRFARNHEKSLEIYQQELSIRHQLGIGGPYLAENYKRIGHTFLELGQPDKAIVAVHQALEVLSDNFSGTDIYQNPTIGQIALKQYGLRVVGNKITSWYFYLQENPKDREAIESSLELAELCLQLWEALRYEFRREQQSKNHSVSIVRRAVQYASLIAHQGYQVTGIEAYEALAFSLAERGKALLLQDTYQRAGAQQAPALSEDLLAREETLRRQQAEYESRLLSAIQDNDSLQVDHLRNDLIFALKEEQAELMREIERGNPGYYQWNYRPLSVSATEILPWLDDDQVFVEYLRQKDAKKLLIFVLQKNTGLKLYQVPLPEDADATATAYYKLLRSHQLNRGDKKRRFVQLSNELYELLILPIESHLYGKGKITIVGEAFTNYIPFETLLPTPEIKPYPELDFLVKHHEISYHYSAGLWIASQQQMRTYDGDLLTFAPVFEQGDKSHDDATRSPWASSDTILRSVDHKGRYTPLKYSGEEAKSIVSLFEKHGAKHVELLLRNAATEASLKHALKQSYRFVHLASHSFSDLKRPKLSGIACLPEAEEGPENGILFSGEIYDMSINSNLVVLSSCESGVGKIISGDGMLGLNRSFVAAGVPNVVFSLWKVFDRIGSEMMVEFYREVLENEQSYASALRRVKLKFLEKEESASPEFWAAFLLIGE